MANAFHESPALLVWRETIATVGETHTAVEEPRPQSRERSIERPESLFPKLRLGFIILNTWDLMHSRCGANRSWQASDSKRWTDPPPPLTPPNTNIYKHTIPSNLLSLPQKEKATIVRLCSQQRNTR